jgi:hypothetical protein
MISLPVFFVRGDTSGAFAAAEYNHMFLLYIFLRFVNAAR